MKKLLSILAISAIASSLNAQFNTPFHQSTSNSIQNGYVGIGTKPSANNTTIQPNFNFQVHGVSNFTYTPPAVFGGGTPMPINYGISSRIGITNSITGSEESAGGLFLMTRKNFLLKNQESEGDLELAASTVSMILSGSTQRVYIGGAPSNSSNYGKFNIVSSDNGVSIVSQNSSKYALRLKVPGNNSNLIEGFGSDNSKPNFQVNGAGEVYARRYITTLQPFPDYVFQPDYKLRTFSELRSFINTNKHLPNMPTAFEVEENGADIGEINRLLVEKVEELTLYILQLEERTKSLEENK